MECWRQDRHLAAGIPVFLPSETSLKALKLRLSRPYFWQAPDGALGWTGEVPKPHPDSLSMGSEIVNALLLIVSFQNYSSSKNGR